MTDSEIIDYYYTEAVKDFKEDWYDITDLYSWYDHVVQLPEKEKVVYLIAILDDQVNNGGFNQYFVNSYGQFAVETVRCLNLINAHATAKIVKLAYEAVNAEDYDTPDFIKMLRSGKLEQLYESDELDDYLHKLDHQYYEYPDDLGKLLGTYLRS